MFVQEDAKSPRKRSFPISTGPLLKTLAIRGKFPFTICSAANFISTGFAGCFAQGVTEDEVVNLATTLVLDPDEVTNLRHRRLSHTDGINFVDAFRDRSAIPPVLVPYGHTVRVHCWRENVRRAFDEGRHLG